MLGGLAALAMVFSGCSGARGTTTTTTAVMVTPREVVAAAKATLEQWRQAYEVRSLDALAPLYAHDLDVVVVVEGTPLIGWSSVEAMLKDRLARAGTIHVRLKDIGVSSLGPTAASVVATMSREVTAGATTVTEAGTLTLALRHDHPAAGSGGAWVIVAEHYSYRRP